MNKHLIHAISATIIILASLAVYLNSFRGEFVWDDRDLIVDNVSLREIGNIPHFFKGDVWRLTNNPPSPYYRPLNNTVRALEYWLWGENPSGYHAFNIIAHALLSLLLYILFLDILGTHTAAFFSALIFASHPVHSENVAWISAGAYIVCAIFIVLAMLFYMRFSDRLSSGYLMISTLCYVCAVFSYEYALMFPFVIFAYEYILKNRLIRIKMIVPYIFVVLLYLAARTIVVLPMTPPEFPVYSRLLTSPVLIIKYLYAFFFPLSLKVFYDILPVTTLLETQTILSFVVLSVIVFLLVLMYRKEKKAFFALLWFFIFIFPVANIIVVLKPQMMALRYLYIPSIGLALLSGIYVKKIFPKPALFMAAFVLLLSFKTYTQNEYWKDGISLNEKIAQDAPSSVIARNNLGVAYLRAGMPSKALLEFQKAVELDPANSFAAFNLGNTYQKFNRLDEAILYLKRAIEMNPSYSRAYNSLGSVYRKLGRYQEAARVFERALDIMPSNYLAHYNLASLLTIMNREDEATGHYIEFVKLAPAAYEKKKLFVRKMLLMKGIVIEE